MNNGRCILVIVLVLSFPSFVYGNAFRIVPSISVKEEFNSNILFATDNIKSDFITTISPGLAMVNRTGRLDSELMAQWDRREYANNRTLSATNQTYNGKLRYLVTPRLSISAEAGYLKNSNQTLDIATTGTVQSDVTLNRVTSSLSADYQISEKAAASVSYAYRKDYYNDPRYLDNFSHDVSAGLVYDFGKYLPLVKGRVNVGYSRFSYPDSLTDSVTATVGLSRDITETWSVHADGGVRRTSSDITQKRLVPVFDFSLGFPVQIGTKLVKEQVKNDSQGWVANASLNYKGEKGSGSLMYSRDISTTYGFNTPTERNALTLSTQYRLTYELSASFAAAYYTFTPDPSASSTQFIKQRNFRINPGVRYEFSKDASAEASYEYARIEYPVLHTEANRHVWFVRLYIQHPFFE